MVMSANVKNGYCFIIFQKTSKILQVYLFKKKKHDPNASWLVSIMNEKCKMHFFYLLLK